MENIFNIKHLFIISTLFIFSHTIASINDTSTIRIPILNQNGVFLSKILNTKLIKNDLSPLPSYLNFKINSSYETYWSMKDHLENINKKLGTDEELANTHPKYLPGLCYIGEPSLIPFIFMNLKDNFLSDQLVVYAFEVNGQKWFSEFETNIQDKIKSSYPENWRNQLENPNLNSNDDVSIIFAVSDDQDERDEVVLKKCMN